MACVYLCLEAFYVALPDETLLSALHVTIVAPAGWLLGHLDPQDHVQAIGNRLVSNRVDFAIVRGCDGSGLLFLLTAAIIALPSSFRQKVSGVLLSAALTYLLNLTRLLALYLIQRSMPQWFVAAHVFWAPGILLIAGTLFFLTWMQRVDAVPLRT